MKKKINVAIVGIGGYGQKLADAVKRTAILKLSACYHENEEKAGEFAKKNQCSEFSDFKKMLENNVDAVIVATPNHLHYKYAMEALKENKHVFVEKPIANKIEEALELENKAKEKKLILMVGHNARRNNAIRKIKEFLDSGKIGKFVSAEINMSHAGGMKLSAANWRYYKEKCPGGPLMMLGSHAADISNYLFGPAIRVCSIVKKLHAPTEAEDMGMAIIELQNGGLIYLANNYNTPTTHFIRVYGTAGILGYNRNLSSLTFQGVDNGREPAVTEEIDFIKNDTILEEMEEFGNCVATGKKTETSAPEGIEALKIINGALSSARERKFINL